MLLWLAQLTIKQLQGFDIDRRPVSAYSWAFGTAGHSSLRQWAMEVEVLRLVMLEELYIESQWFK